MPTTAVRTLYRRLKDAERFVREALPPADATLLAGVEIRLVAGFAPDEQAGEVVYGQWSRAFQLIEIIEGRVRLSTLM
jgi:hypothetical protein